MVTRKARCYNKNCVLGQVPSTIWGITEWDTCPTCKGSGKALEQLIVINFGHSGGIFHYWVDSNLESKQVFFKVAETFLGHKLENDSALNEWIKANQVTIDIVETDILE